MGDGQNPKLFPQTINVSCTFYVLHTHKLGWRKNEGDKKFQSKAGFPHDMNPGAKKFVGVPTTEAGKIAAAGEMSVEKSEALDAFKSARTAVELAPGTRVRYNPDTGLDEPVFG